MTPPSRGRSSQDPGRRHENRADHSGEGDGTVIVTHSVQESCWQVWPEGRMGGPRPKRLSAAVPTGPSVERPMGQGSGITDRVIPIGLKIARRQTAPQRPLRSKPWISSFFNRNSPRTPYQIRNRNPAKPQINEDGRHRMRCNCRRIYLRRKPAVFDVLTGYPVGGS
jgi:hypothetical protein